MDDFNVQLKILQNNYFDKKFHSVQSNSDYLDQIYYLKKKLILDSTGLESLNRFEEFVQNQIQKSLNFKTSLLAVIATIFLPLTFVVGYFGMNFKSMGVPSLKHGIFTIKHGQHYIFFLALIIVLLMVLFFRILEKYLISEIPSKKSQFYSNIKQLKNKS